MKNKKLFLKIVIKQALNYHCPEMREDNKIVIVMYMPQWYAFLQ